MSRLVEYLGGSAVRETTSVGQGPVVETDKARFNALGPFLVSNMAQGAAAAAMLLAGVATVVDMIAPRAGKVVGLAIRSNADLTAGTATFKAKVGSSQVGVSVVLSDPVQQRITNFAVPGAFAAGDLLSVTSESDGSYAPATADHQAWLLVEWSPIDG
jgi:hypothetical protein